MNRMTKKELLAALEGIRNDLQYGDCGEAQRNLASLIREVNRRALVNNSALAEARKDYENE